MGRTCLVALLGMLLLAAPAVARAQATPAGGSTPPDDTQAARVGALIFLDFTYQKAPKITDAAGNTVRLSSFNAIRSYINITGTISHVVSFRITPDVSRETGTGTSLDGSMSFRLKYAYANFALDDWMWRGSYARFGMQQNPFIDTQESVYRYRFQGTVFAERDGGLPSSDVGAAFRAQLPNNYGDAYIGVFNGEGYAKPEVNDQKALMLRTTLRPLPKAKGIARNLRVTFFYNGDHYVNDGERRRFIASGMVEHRRFNAGFDYIDGADQPLPTATRVHSDGYSFFITPFFKTKGDGPEALIRYDSFRQDSDTDARRNRVIAGLAYWFPHPGGNATAAILLDYEQVSFKNFATPQVTQQKIILHGLISF